MKLVTFSDSVGLRPHRRADRRSPVRGRFHGRGGSPAFASMLGLIDAGPAGLDAARKLHGGRQARRSRLDKVKLLAPLPEPRQMRDCLVFEKHLMQAREQSFRRLNAKAADLEAKVEAAKRRGPLQAGADLVQAADLLQGQPLLGDRHRPGHPVAALCRAARLRARVRHRHRQDRQGHRQGQGPRAHLRLHDLQRRQRARRAGRRDAGPARPGQGQGLRHRQRARPLAGDGRRDR